MTTNRKPLREFFIIRKMRNKQKNCIFLVLNRRNNFFNSLKFFSSSFSFQHMFKGKPLLPYITDERISINRFNILVLAFKQYVCDKYIIVNVVVKLSCGRTATITQQISAEESKASWNCQVFSQDARSQNRKEKQGVNCPCL